MIPLLLHPDYAMFVSDSKYLNQAVVLSVSAKPVISIGKELREV